MKKAMESQPPAEQVSLAVPYPPVSERLEISSRLLQGMLANGSVKDVKDIEKALSYAIQLIELVKQKEAQND